MLASDAPFTVVAGFEDDPAWLAACDAFDRRADVSRIVLPSLILCGEADRMTPVKFSQFLHEQIAGSELIVMPVAGHMVMLEQPAAVAKSVAAFLSNLALF